MVPPLGFPQRRRHGGNARRLCANVQEVGKPGKGVAANRTTCRPGKAVVEVLVIVNRQSNPTRAPRKRFIVIAGATAEPRVPLDRGRMTVTARPDGIAAAPASELNRSAAEETNAPFAPFLAVRLLPCG